MRRKIAIIGTSYVGLTTGSCLSYLGHKVICVDKDGEKIQNLKKGINPIFEPGLGNGASNHLGLVTGFDSEHNFMESSGGERMVRILRGRVNSITKSRLPGGWRS